MLGRVLAVAAILFAASNHAAGQQQGGGSVALINACRHYITATQKGAAALGVKEKVEAIKCVSFLEGFVAGYYQGTFMYTVRPMLICFPQVQVSNQQLATVYVQWADKHVNKWHEPGWETILDAFAEAFPCKDIMEGK